MLGAALLAASLVCAPVGARDVVGFWESEETSKGGIGSTLEFRSDGSAVAATVVLVNLSYRVSGDRLVVNQQTPGDTIRLQGDRLWHTGPDGAVVEKRRVTSNRSNDKGIVGVWTYQHYTGAVAYERYTGDGQLQFRLVLSSYPGCYSADGTYLTMTQPTASTESYAVHGDRLTLNGQGKKAFLYRRVPGGAWYPREPLASPKRK